jgi:hypothetical protein
MKSTAAVGIQTARLFVDERYTRLQNAIDPKNSPEKTVPLQSRADTVHFKLGANLHPERNGGRPSTSLRSAQDATAAQSKDDLPQE